jgi:hypothetical protein
MVYLPLEITNHILSYRPSHPLSRIVDVLIYIYGELIEKGHSFSDHYFNEIYRRGKGGSRGKVDPSYYIHRYVDRC